MSHRLPIIERLMPLGCFLVVLLVPQVVLAQASQHALRFYGTGVGPPGQQDRVRIPIDDNVNGPDASTPCDVGAGDFTVEFWLRGRLLDNNTPNSGGDTECFCNNWIEGNIIVDRDIWGGSDRDWGVSIAGGFVRFGTGRGDAGLPDSEHTLEGNINVLDDQWHHVAVVRDAGSGQKYIFVDGNLDIASPPGRSDDDISYPNDGDPGAVTPWGPYIVLAAEKHDAGAAYPSFNGFMDEVRIWSISLAGEIEGVYGRIVKANSAGLMGYYRFEEGAGTSLADASASQSAGGELIAGTPGNGEWVSRSVSPQNVAPIDFLPGDLDYDHDVDSSDVAIFVGVLLGNITDPETVAACNLNFDAEVNGADIAALIEAMLS